MNANLKSLILSTLLQGATKGKPVSFHWSNRLKKITVEMFASGISVVIPRKQFIKDSITIPKK